MNTAANTSPNNGGGGVSSGANAQVSGNGYARMSIPADGMTASAGVYGAGTAIIGGARQDFKVDGSSSTWTCEDCGKEVTEPHAPDCVTRAVDEGRMTPRERQIARYDRRQAEIGTSCHRYWKLEDRSMGHFLTCAIDEVQGIGRVPKVLRVNPVDFHRLTVELRPQQASSARVKFKGVEILADGDIPEGEVIAYTDGLFDHKIADFKVAREAAGRTARQLAAYQGLGRITNGSITNLP